ncbi:MAG: DNA translocase FtsK [Lactobacillus sp.]|jgi:S-DNA-T family DNA segregation ATPase FtsK/SpoIIIE|nr:DNA translocase FtsK [Lactobacillus sp.]MCI1973192.1 DNA translocase FtsK [Lactobacillus sp.]
MAKKKKRKRSRRKRKQKSYTWSITGIVLLMWALLAGVKLGWLGRQLANALRFFVGDGYLIFAILLGILGLVMVVYNQPPHWGWKRNCGLLLLALGFLLCLSQRYFNRLMINHGFINVFMQAIGGEFARGQAAHALGGGIIGTALYSCFFPLISSIGTVILGWLGMLTGLLMLFDIKFVSVLTGVQKAGQGIVTTNQKAGHALQKQYQDLVEKRKVKNRQKLQDPLQKDEQPFPDLSDFKSQQPTDETSDSVSDDASIESVEPEIISQPEPDLNEVVANEPARPLSHGDLADDQQVPHNLGSVEHHDDLASEPVKPVTGNYQLPPVSLLDPIKHVDQSEDRALIRTNTNKLEQTLASFGVKVKVKTAVLGPTVTRYEVQPAVGVKVSRVVNLADDLALALAAKDIRIEAPIPGKPLIGIEVPNKNTSSVNFKDVMEHQSQRAKKNPLAIPLGKDVAGRVVSADLRKMPHLLIAGSTGSGKSVAVNTFITSILMKAKPDQVKLVLIDPKMVELSTYNDVPHLLIPVVTNARLAANALHKTVKEMERRYKLFAASGTRNMAEFNQKVQENNRDKSRPVMQPLPYIVVIVDELSDLMMVAGHEVEDAIVRLAQMARAAGIHMVLATQRPSVDVITGLIKANVPSRISFAVSSGIDSRTILDQVGAEKLIGRGDMLFLPIGAAKPERIQGAYISVDEVERVAKYVKDQQQAVYSDEMMPTANAANDEGLGRETEDLDEYYDEAVALVRKQKSASVSMLQRRFRIGYNRAARIVDQMEANGVVGPSEGSKPRKVLPPKKDDQQA